MLVHEMHMKVVANDRLSSYLREADIYRLTRKSRRPHTIVRAIGKGVAVVRLMVSSLSAAGSAIFNDRRLFS